MLRNFRYTTLSWHSTPEIDEGADYPQLVGVSSTGCPIDCTKWETAKNSSIHDCRAEGPSRPRPQEPFAMLPQPTGDHLRASSSLHQKPVTR